MRQVEQAELASKVAHKITKSRNSTFEPTTTQEILKNQVWRKFFVFPNYVDNREPHGAKKKIS